MALKRLKHGLYKLTCLALDELGRPLHVKKRKVFASSCDKIKAATITFDELRMTLNEFTDMQVYEPDTEHGDAPTKECYVVTKRSSKHLRLLLDRHCEIKTKHAIAIETMMAMGDPVHIG
ncbi:MAG: hypothetical protein WDZ93_01010 [Candidatus Paceibacterota bacterium]